MIIIIIIIIIAAHFEIPSGVFSLSSLPRLILNLARLKENQGDVFNLLNISRPLYETWKLNPPKKLQNTEVIKIRY